MSTIVGQQLRQARQAKDLSLEQVSRMTHIRRHYLDALELGDLGALPSEVQARGFVRTYASFLEIPVEPLLEGFDHEKELTSPAIERGTHSPEDSLEQVSDGSEKIFKEIGNALREHRELLGFTLLDIERQTHIRMHYLEALEAGCLDKLPSPVQGRGMLNNYASFMGLDPNPLLLKFADGLQSQLATRRSELETGPIPPPGSSLPLPLRRLISGDLIFGGLIIIALLAFVFWGTIRVSSLQSGQAPSATAPAIVDVLLPSPTPSSTPTQVTPPPGENENGTGNGNGQATPTISFDLPIASDAAVQLYIAVRERAWMRVTVDGTIAFEGRVIPGSAYSYSGQESIELLTGSGSALQVFHNQEDLGPLGLFGEVVQRIFTAEGVLLPTPTITPTPSITPTASATETPTATAVP
jgi:cytoskeletal protein RodZ